MTTVDTEIHGRVAEGFEPVQEAFARNFADHGEAGAACAITVGGNLVVDVWAGTRDRQREQPWTEDTIVNLYSTTKGITALCAHLLADRGQLDFDAPVVEYWPEFAASEAASGPGPSGNGSGKATMPVRYLLTHQAGLPVIDEDLPENATLDWARMVEALERQTPLWQPGERQGYHAMTYGWLVGEVVRRVSGASSFGAFLAAEVAAPLGVDFFVGTPEREDHRVAHLVRDRANPAASAGDQAGAPAEPESPEPESPETRAARRRMQDMAAPDSWASRSLGLGWPPFSPSNNDRRWRAAEIPGANGTGNARALAKIYGALACGGEIGGVRLLSAESVRRAAAEQVRGPDAVLSVETRRSLGFMLPVSSEVDYRGPAAFGHAGAGGSLGYADPEQGIGFGYTMNKMWGGDFMAPDPRAQNLIAALNRSLEHRAA